MTGGKCKQAVAIFHVNIICIDCTAFCIIDKIVEFFLRIEFRTIPAFILCFGFIFNVNNKYSKNLPLLRFDMENMAAENGEVLYIDSMAFFTDKDESLKYMPATTYPIKEQTADNYVAKIMSFNVQTENGTQVRADIRADMLRDLLDEYMPDSIGLQEVTTLWRGMMDNFIFNKSYASVGEPRTPGGEANPIYYRVDKYELIDSGTFWLSDTPDVSGSKFEGSQYVRICTWAHLRDRVTGNEFIHFNTHLDSLGGSDGRALRKQQIIVILKFLQRFGDLPMIFSIFVAEFSIILRFPQAIVATRNDTISMSFLSEY